MIEVEAKYRLADPASFEAALLTDFGGRFLREAEQRDVYFQHPARDFRETDEALRVRQTGDRAILCYKGPRLDTRTKTRSEFESEFGHPVESLTSILTALGFVPCGVVAKRRRKFQSTLLPDAVIAVDLVESLGSFAEIELISDEAGRAESTAALLAFADTLGLRDSIRESYLELLWRQGKRESSPEDDR